MQSRGVTLVEIVVVTAITSILLALGLPNFIDYWRRCRCEAQTRTIYDELMKARASAMHRKTPTRVKLYPTRLEVYASVAESENGAPPILRQELRHRVIQSKSGNEIDFDERGMTYDERSICLEDGGGAGVDSVIVGNLRTSIGKRGKGPVCNAENITRR